MDYLEREKVQRKMQEVLTMQKEVIKRESYLDPRRYGMPDLLFPRNTLPAKLTRQKDGMYKIHKRQRLEKDETIDEYRKRRYEYLRDFIEEKISIQKDGRKIPLKIVDQVLEFVGDLFFGYTRRAILWKSRGGGGSVASALVLWMRMIYHAQSFLDMAGCLLPDTDVYTKEHGFLPIKSVNTDMHAWTLTQGWQKIKRHIKKYGHYDVYRFIPYKSRYSDFTSDHKIAVVSCLIRDIDGEITNIDQVQKWDLMDVTWKQAKDVNPETDCFILGRPDDRKKDNVVSEDRKNCICFSKDRVYITVEDIDTYEYSGAVYDLTIENEPYFACSNMTVHNSLEQAKNLYEYTKDFWDSFPEFKAAVLDGDPLLSKTKLKSGVELTCTTTTEKSARGKHKPGLCLDEVCQDKADIDQVFVTAINAALSEANHTIICLSTFHIPVGLFQELWDHAEERGFKRYNWSVYDIMEQCTEGLGEATKRDPYNLKFCFTQCPLTIRKIEKVRTGDGIIERVAFGGCKGKARTSRGFMRRKNVLDSKKVNKNNVAFETEWENDRPIIRGCIYNTNDLDAAIKKEIKYSVQTSYSAVGIDWGWVEGCMCYVRLCPRYLVVLEASFMNMQSVQNCIDQVKRWEDKYETEVCVFADSSHMFNINDFDQAGFDITAVDFGIVKEMGISNLTKYFANRRIQISSDLYKFNSQIRGYKRNPRTGIPIKKDDHAADSLLAATIELSYDEVFGDAPMYYDGEEDDIKSFVQKRNDKSSNDEVMLF